MSRTSTRTAFSPRDLRLLVAFGLFVEVVLGYMLLVDGPLSQLGKSQALHRTAQEAHQTLKQAVDARSLEKRAQEAAIPAVPFLVTAEGETPSMAIQEALDAQAETAGARLKTVRVEPEPLDEAGLDGYRTAVALEGSYEAIATFVRALEAPRQVLGVEAVSISADSEKPDRLHATLTVRFYLQKP